MIKPTIHFNGDCLEAICLYESAFEVTNKKVTLYKDGPKSMKDNLSEKTLGYVMHSELTIEGSPMNMSDHLEKRLKGDMICLNVILNKAEDVKRAYNVLSLEGEIVVPLGKQFFSDCYGAVIDKFGVKWQLIS